MKKTILVASLIGATNLFAKQTDTTLVVKVNELQVRVDQQKEDIIKLYSELDKDYWT